MLDIPRLDIVIMIFCSLVVWVILLLVEVVRRLNIIRGEEARKSIHILVGIFIATWPIFMTRPQIIAMNLLFFVGLILLSGTWHLFKALEDVQRWTLGQFLYPIGVILVTLITRDQYVYAFSVLVLALADAFAAIVGKRYGKRFYHILGGNKTFIGSLTFFLVCCTVIGSYAFLRYEFGIYPLAVMFAGSAFLTFIEAMFAGGFDNLAVPAMAALMLQSLGS